MCESTWVFLRYSAPCLHIKYAVRTMYKIMQGSVTGCHQDVHNIFLQGSQRDLGQNLHISLSSKSAAGNFGKIVIKRAKSGTTLSWQPAQLTCTWTSQKNNLRQKKTGKMRQAKTATTVSCEPAQSECTWTGH